MTDIIDNGAEFNPEQHVNLSGLNIPEVPTNPLGEEVSEIANEGRFRKAYNVAKRAVQLSVIAAEVSPANELLRYGALTYALAHSNGGPLIGAAALGGTTLVVEGSAALSTADLITTETSTKGLKWLNSKLHRFIPEHMKMSPVAEFGTAMTMGSAIVLAEKQREDPEITARESKRHGKFTASWMAGYFALEGAFIGANSEHGDVLNPKTIGAAAIATAVTWAGTKWAASRGRKRSEQNQDEEAVK